MTKKIALTIQEVEDIVVEYALKNGLITSSDVKLRWWLDDGNSTLTISENKL